MGEAIEQAKKGRLYMLDIMGHAREAPRAGISPHAPRIIKIKISPDKIRDVIGPGGKVIRALVEETGAKIDVEDGGTGSIAAADRAAAGAAGKRTRGPAAGRGRGQDLLRDGGTLCSL